MGSLFGDCRRQGSEDSGLGLGQLDGVGAIDQACRKAYVLRRKFRKLVERRMRLG
jgi:hypothetical protein